MILDLTPIIQAVEDACTRPESEPLFLLIGTLEVLRARCLRVLGERTVGHSAEPSHKTEYSSRSERLLTAREIGTEIGPSWTPKKLYRLRSSMPESLTVRKGGRLYFRETPFKEWLRTR